jgi:alkanesulfonate monooxygenase SsuD/methylene tetrahydromethanopterin reductase-like flavin-dependent oxidoreductase (luciferase family)
MTAAQLTLAEAYPDRFLLGLGVSHARLVEGLRGHQYERPLTAMRRYLDAMDKAAEAYRAVKPGERPARVLAAWPLARRRGCRGRSSRHKAPCPADLGVRFGHASSYTPGSAYQWKLSTPQRPND